MKKELIDQTVGSVIIILIFTFFLTRMGNIISFTVIAIPLILEIYTTIKFAYKKIRYIKSFDKITFLEIEDAIQKPIFKSTDYVLTDKFIFNKYDIELIKYSDIYLLKKDWTISLGRASDIYDCVYIVTNKGNYCLRANKSDFLSSKRDLDEFLLAQNKEILIDDTLENKKILKDKYNIDLKKNWKLKSKRTKKIIRFYI